jgi:hypothetical protein
MTTDEAAFRSGERGLLPTAPFDRINTARRKEATGRPIMLARYDAGDRLQPLAADVVLGQRRE